MKHSVHCRSIEIKGKVTLVKYIIIGMDTTNSFMTFCRGQDMTGIMTTLEGCGGVIAKWTSQSHPLHL